jgi:hypothetical protein
LPQELRRGEAGEIQRMSTPPPSDAAARPDPFSPDLIAKEITHLKKGRSVRQAQDSRRSKWRIFLFVVVVALLGLYGMDPMLFSYDRGDAIQVYLYLHNYGNDHEADTMVACGLLTPGEAHQLRLRQGSFQDYFDGTKAAEEKAAALVRYMNGVHDLHQYRYAALTPLNKLRYILFMKTGLTPPISWNALNSSIDK